MAKMGGGCGKVLFSAVDLLAVAYSQYQNSDLGIIDTTDDTKISNAVTPEARKSVSQRLAKAARVF